MRKGRGWMFGGWMEVESGMLWGFEVLKRRLLVIGMEEMKTEFVLEFGLELGLCFGFGLEFGFGKWFQ